MDFAFPAEHWVEIKKSEKIDKKTWKSCGTWKWMIPIVFDAFKTISKREKSLGTRDQKKNWDHIEHSTVKISQNT